jgi:hypothetical protein
MMAGLHRLSTLNQEMKAAIGRYNTNGTKGKPDESSRAFGEG